jgi:hypothetical protein
MHGTKFFLRVISQSSTESRNIEPCRCGVFSHPFSGLVGAITNLIRTCNPIAWSLGFHSFTGLRLSHLRLSDL